MIYNHGAAGGDGLLNRGATSFADKQMALTKQAWQLIGPTQDVDPSIPGHQFDCAADSNVMSDRDGQVDVQIEKLVDQFGRVSRAGVDHIENAALRFIRRRSSILREVRKFRAHRKSECLNFTRRDAASADDRRALFIGNEKIIGLAAIPDGVHRNRISDNDHALAAAT